MLPPSHIHSCVSYIYNDKSPRPNFPPGILTTENRDIWANVRNELIQAGNEETLNLIDSAAFNIVFDENVVNNDPIKCFEVSLYGDGSNR